MTQDKIPFRIKCEAKKAEIWNSKKNEQVQMSQTTGVHVVTYYNKPFMWSKQ